MPALYRRADAFLHMSRDEPSGLVYLEAAATGLPLVVHDNEVTRWTLGESALFTDTSDSVRVADCLREALDPDRVAQLGTSARQRILEGWTWEVLGARYRDFLLELLETRSASALCGGVVS